MIPFSILDLCPVTQDIDAAQALKNTLDLAQHAEKWGYHRYWLAEHHNMVGVASAATSVVIGHVANGTKTIRVGSGGIMLPNHAPLVIAEQFGTLASLYPDRIDLGIGRAPGSDQRTMRALRREVTSADNFPQDVRELEFYFQAPTEDQAIRAVPGAGLKVPIWILGSSLYGAQLAAAFGLPFAFASHFMPDQIVEALHIYRSGSKPSKHLQKPYAAIGVNVFAADTDEEAKYHFTSLQQQFFNLRYGKPGKIQPPIKDLEESWHPLHTAAINHALSYSAVGSKDTISKRLKEIIDLHKPDEIITTATMYDHQARLRSFEITAEALKTI
jgi:luciferase family oxidoreductase group 1